MNQSDWTAARLPNGDHKWTNLTSRRSIDGPPPGWNLVRFTATYRQEEFQCIVPLSPTPGETSWESILTVICAEIKTDSDQKVDIFSNGNDVITNVGDFRNATSSPNAIIHVTNRQDLSRAATLNRSLSTREQDIYGDDEYGDDALAQDEKVQDEVEAAAHLRAGSPDPPTGRISTKLREAVSKKKRRFVDEEFNLDLTYITRRIIAMGFPSEGTEATYRNPMEDVQRFFVTRHPSHYKIYNLCIEREYVPESFEAHGGQVARYPFKDHNVPTIQMMDAMCQDIKQFLAADAENVVAIHCKAGKGRTGLIIAAYLVFDNIYAATDIALSRYGEARTENGKGVTIPSQKRFVSYFEKYIKTGRTINLSTVKFLTKMVMYTIPNFDLDGGCDPYFVILDLEGSILYDYSNDHRVQHVRGQEKVTFDNLRVELHGEVKLVFYDKDFMSKDDLMCWCWLHPAFVDDTVRLPRIEIDGAAKDKKGHFDEAFAVEMSFSNH